MKSTLNQPVICADGFKMSVQANDTAYCDPQVTGAAHYKSVEVGYPNAPETLLIGYSEDPENPTGTVYPRVPSALVSLVIAKHGGMVSGEVPPGVAQLRPTKEDQ